MSHPVSGMQAVLVEAGGAPLPPALTVALREIRVFQMLSRPTLVELAFQGGTTALEDLVSAFPQGLPLRLTLGTGREELFSGSVTAVTYETGPDLVPLFRVRGYDALQRLRQRQTVRAFVDVDAARLAGELTADLGIAISGGGGGPVWPRLIQHDQSDFGLLESTAARAGLHFVLHQGSLCFFSQEGFGEPVPLRMGATLREMRVEANSDRAWKEVVTSGWSPREVRSETAREGSACPLPDAPAVPSGEGVRHRVAATVPGEAHSRALAKGMLDGRRAASFHLWGVGEGNPELRPGRRVTLEGAGTSLSGSLVVAQARHRFDVTHGFTTEIDTCPEEPDPGREPPLTLTVPGVVVRVDDPEDLSRVRVSLPTIGDVETDWMPVVLPGVGKGKGLIAMPDVGDKVLVLCPGGDPSFGVVVGGLPGADHHSDSGAGGSGIARYLLGNAAGQSLLLDAARKSLKLESNSGGRLEITPGGVQLHSKGNLTIDAPGHTITIRGKAIQFEES